MLTRCAVESDNVGRDLAYFGEGVEQVAKVGWVAAPLEDDGFVGGFGRV